MSNEKLLITFGPRKVLEIPKDQVGIVMKKKAFTRLINEMARVQNELGKGRAVVIKKVMAGMKVIYMEDEDVGNEGSKDRGLRTEKRGKKK